MGKGSRPSFSLFSLLTALMWLIPIFLGLRWLAKKSPSDFSYHDANLRLLVSFFCTAIVVGCSLHARPLKEWSVRSTLCYGAILGMVCYGFLLGPINLDLPVLIALTSLPEFALRVLFRGCLVGMSVAAICLLLWDFTGYVELKRSERFPYFLVALGTALLVGVIRLVLVISARPILRHLPWSGEHAFRVIAFATVLAVPYAMILGLLCSICQIRIALRKYYLGVILAYSMIAAASLIAESKCNAPVWRWLELLYTAVAGLGIAALASVRRPA